ncbi:glycosyltransferase family 4 protein [Stackebrandtia nassauensis]|uniref:Glycosyl transferase group 1 n=1 Tax=Stackebrandtia nassauensis (strain DSM 44728 / CIP 108903 / NRRL B-16338 / NBRC 102104 / LLR-40K-21) TaxID=446470 RepID=D3Q1Q1_STANL|nr:glycosyltransferase family 4 protein [Stackebrandtia nassauensis]ADD39899.1 glycosyl transferase group 1 [Stackebrandtia nassauensis DSM 44728]
MKVTFLVHSLDRVGGITRATLTTASALAARGHGVRIAAIFRLSSRPRFDVDPRVEVVTLVDEVDGRRRSTRDSALRKRPSRIHPRGDTFYEHAYTELVDARLTEFLNDCEADVVVGTTPGLNVCLAALAPRGAITVAQEHMFYEHHEPSLRAELSRAYERMDAVVTLTQRDAARHRRELPHLASRVTRIPNSVPAPPRRARRPDNRVIVAAGRLEPAKNFAMLIDAFAIVHRHHPEWRLRVVGDGSQLDGLRAQIQRLGLSHRVSLPGMITPMDREWAAGGIAALSSDFESFGLTVIEAMHFGLPVVSTHCRYGPPEIITDGEDGLLCPVGDAERFGAALCRLIEDRALWRRCSRTARRTAGRYVPEEVVADYEKLFNRQLEHRDLSTLG